MSEKIFEGQYSGEKILLRAHPHIVHFFLERIHLFASYLFVIFAIFLIGMLVNPKFLTIYIVLSIIIFAIFVAHFLFLYGNSRYTITSRRLIYFIRKSLFKRFYNEIHLVDLRTAVPKKSGIFGAIFGYGTLIVADKDEKKITYPGMREHKFLSRYLGRVIDYIKIHGHTDNLSSYQPRKIREEIRKNPKM